MGCGSCTKSGLPKGCNNNGSCGVEGCEKLTVFDWLSDMELPGQQPGFDVLEIRFKNGRKGYFRNEYGHNLHIGDVVAVQGSPGHDVGAVSLSGELVRLQMKKKSIDPASTQLPKVYRKVSQHDIDIWQSAQKREKPTMVRSRQLAKELGLEMKISDVEFQGDNSKATFYYIADGRVDFRKLIKMLASEFKVRIEMRQIGSRQEAGKIGGIGSCGRELCCSTWLTDFRSVNTSAARFQQLALNPQKLAGQCGKLKCCLNYELDTYLDALKKFPDTETELQTQKGKARFQKMDIFKEKMWYAYREAGMEWIALDLQDVQQIMDMNAQGETPESLEYFAGSEERVAPAYNSGVGQDDLNRFDRKKKRKKPGRKHKKGKKTGPRDQKNK